MGKAGPARWLRDIAILGLLVTTGAVTGGCSDDEKAIFIVRPGNGDVLTLADDANADPADGLQFEVVANTSGFEDGAPLVLFVNGAQTAEATIDGERVSFPDVDLPGGQVELFVCGDETCDIQSNTVTVSVNAECPTIDFIAPAPPAMANILTLGADADEDAEACGQQFTTTVQVSTTAGSGQMARLVVNGNMVGSTTVSGSLATFEGVVLDVDATSEIEVFVETTSGAECGAQYPVPVEVDCTGLGCSITAPSTETGFLNTSDDTSTSMPGLQTTVEVTTGAEAVGETVDLFIDGALVSTGDVRAVDSDGIANFASTLSEGTHTVQAQCRDPLGNITSSAALEWTVDLDPCGISIDTIAGLSTADPPESRILTPGDDIDTGAPGVQVELAGELLGVGCTEVRVGACGSIEGVAFEPAGSAASYAQIVSLSTQATQNLCAEVRDEAGNVARADVTTFFETDAPNVSIIFPTEATRYNAQGGTYTVDGQTFDYVVDLDPTTVSCNAEIRVACGDDRGTVSLFREGETTPLVGGGPIDCPSTGEAIFDNVRFPSTAGGTPFNLVAHHTVERLPEGISAPLSIRSDCSVPQLQARNPQCGAVLRPADQSDPSDPDLEFDVSVTRQVSDVPEAVLEVIQQSTSNVTTAGPEPFVANVALFQDVPFGAAGIYQLRACATDALDNTGCIEGCTVTVGDVPTVEITEPLPMEGMVYGSADDCDTGTTELELQVTATTDAVDGAVATIRIGAEGSPEAQTTTTTVVGGQISVCMPAPQGESVPVVVSIEAPDTGLVGSSQVAIDIDSIPPVEPIDDLSLVSPDLPRHTRRFSWTAVPDGDGGLLQDYALRCGNAPIATESDWDAARPLNFKPPVMVASGGTSQTGDAVGFRPATTVHCMLRGEDLAGVLTPLGNSVEVVVPPLEQLVLASDQGLEMGWDVQGVGDVNGDGTHDILVGGNGEAYLYFGFGPDVTPPAGPVLPDVVLRGNPSAWFGRRIAPLGDFSGDGIPDFAVSAPVDNGLKGIVHIFYGRDEATNPWPSTIDVTEPGCQADVCLIGEDGLFDGEGTDIGPDVSAIFGDAIDGIGDFNGDGTADIAIGAPRTNSINGRVYIILGGQFAANDTVAIPQDDTAVDGFILDPPVDADQRFGWHVAGLGRAAGSDSLADVAITASGGTNFDPAREGALYVLEGRSPVTDGLTTLDAASLLTGGTLQLVQRSTPIGNYGSELANAGDLNGDGFVDIGVRHTQVEQVFVFTGEVGGYPSAADYIITNDSADPTLDQIGRDIASAAVPSLLTYGDVDGDGLTDLFFGSQQNPDFPGVGQLFYGERTLPASEPRSSAELTLNPATDGGTVRTPGYIGDIDGDGAWDLAIGDRNHDRTPGDTTDGAQGQVVLYY